jgi:hypothetical protein
MVASAGNSRKPLAPFGAMTLLFVLAIGVFSAIPAVSANSSDLPSIKWPCGHAFPNYSTVDPKDHLLLLPNGTLADISDRSRITDAPFDSGSQGLGVGQMPMRPVVTYLAPPDGTFCSTTTSCGFSVTATAGHVIIVAAQMTSGTLTPSDTKGNSWQTAISNNDGTSGQAGIFYSTVSNGGTDTVSVSTSGSVGAQAIEIYDVSGLASGFNVVTSDGHCTSSCSTSLSTSSLNFLEPDFAIASIFSSAGNSNYNAPGSFFTLHQGTYNAWRASEFQTSPDVSGTSLNAPPTSFPATDGASPSWYVEVGAVFQANYYFTSEQSSWTVPPTPSNTNFGFNGYGGAVNFAFWNGLQTVNTGGDVMQPLLVFGCLSASLWVCQAGGNHWYIVPYYVYFGAGWGTLISVSAGDSITGTVTKATVTCGRAPGAGYIIKVTDTTPVPSITTQLSVCTSDLFNQAVVGELEVHYLTYCNELPNTSSEGMTLSSYGTSPSGLTQSYLRAWSSSCGAGASWNSGTITISWTTSGNF